MILTVSLFWEVTSTELRVHRLVYLHQMNMFYPQQIILYQILGCAIIMVLACFVCGNISTIFKLVKLIQRCLVLCVCTGLPLIQLHAVVLIYHFVRTCVHH